MEDREKDYKKLYEETLLTLSEKEELLLCKEQELTRKEEIISDLKFELDKFLRQLFGAKSEKRDSQAGENQLGLFELGTPGPSRRSFPKLPQ